MRFEVVSLAAGFAATASAQCYGNYFSFYNRAGPAMSYQRLDPGLYPGVVSPHLHSFDGGNGLAMNMDYPETQGSSCTTARVKTDKSLYWRPTLFFKNSTGFHRVPEQSTKIYYKYGDGNNWANVTAYPKGFNMIAGQPKRRSDTGENAAGVRWGCHEPDGNTAPIFDNGFPKGFTTCKYGFASEATFPSCWNGKEMDPNDGYAHMAYPNSNAGVGIENCPTTHRVARFPTLFIEFWWDISSFKFGADEAPWVLSNGDPTGYGFHADFMNGWDEGVLEKAISENDGCKCGCGCGQEQMEQCFGSANVNKDSDESWASCAATNNNRAADDSVVMSVLPGCNPLQYGPASATDASGPGCTAAPSMPAGNNSTKISSAAATKTPAAGNLSSGYPHSVISVTPEAVPAVPEATGSPALPNKGVDTAGEGYDAAKPMPTPSSPYEAPAGDADVEDASSCTGQPTVYKTMTQTVTVQASAKETGSY